MSDGAEWLPHETPPPTTSMSVRGDDQDLVAHLKQHLEETRLPPKVKEQILAELPSPEELERLFRELQAKGGLSSEQFLNSLGLGAEPQP